LIKIKDALTKRLVGSIFYLLLAEDIPALLAFGFKGAAAGSIR